LAFGNFAVRVGWDSFDPLPLLRLKGLRATLLFTFREHCKRRAFLGRVFSRAEVLPAVGNQQLAAIEAYYGARFF
jgi:hypothetical protein